MRSRNTPNRFRAETTLALTLLLVVTILAAAVLGSAGRTTSAHGAGPATSIGLFAIDADPAGNAPRSVGTIEQCTSTSVGRPTQVDIVVPGPGVPADRGIGSYQFSLLYDPGSIWITDDDSNMLLGQAAGSNVIPIADPTPDRNGVYVSWGVDFGPSGIESDGSSEAGSGVIARITILPQSEGISTLTLSDVLVIDDASNRITLESIQSATIYVGLPCPAQSAPPLSPTPPFDSFDTTGAARSTPSAGPFPGTGSGPAAGGSDAPLIAAAFISTFGVLLLITSYMVANKLKDR